MMAREKMMIHGVTWTSAVAAACVFITASPTLRAAEKKDEAKAETPAGQWVVIASYGNDIEGNKALDRIREVMRENGIRWFGVGSASYSMNVTAADEKRARRLVAELVKREKLPVTLIAGMKADRSGYAVTAPEAVLGEK